MTEQTFVKMANWKMVKTKKCIDSIKDSHKDCLLNKVILKVSLAVCVKIKEILL